MFSIKKLIDKFNKNYKDYKNKKEKLENKREQEEFVKRQELYNDMLRDEAQKQKFLNNMNKIKINTYTKKLVAIIIGVSLLDLQITYVLALLGKDQIAESLSVQICTTIISVAFVYMVRAYFDSRAEHKNLDYKIKNELEEGLKDKIQNVLSNAGLNINTEDIFDNEEEDNIEEEERRTPVDNDYNKSTPGVVHYNKKAIDKSPRNEDDDSVG